MFNYPVREDILATLAYYDIFDYPLKAEEIFRYLIKEKNNGIEINLTEIKKELDQLLLERIIDADRKYYFLRDREYLVPLRIKNEKISAKKWEKARQAVGWLKFVPFVEAVYATGSLALNNCDELSDLDILIVACRGRIWLTRLLVAGIIELLGVRRKWYHLIAPDMVCLGHYVTQDKFAEAGDTIYKIQTKAELKPILIKGNKKGFHNSKIGGWLEKLAEKYQIRKIENNPLTPRTPSSDLIYNDEILAFHPDSPEKIIVEKYQNNLKRILNSGI